MAKAKMAKAKAKAKKAKGKMAKAKMARAKMAKAKTAKAKVRVKERASVSDLAGTPSSKSQILRARACVQVIRQRPRSVHAQAVTSRSPGTLLTAVRPVKKVLIVMAQSARRFLLWSPVHLPWSFSKRKRSSRPRSSKIWALAKPRR